MNTSKPNALLSGLILAVCAFVALWWIFVAAIGAAMLWMGWWSLFRTTWQEIVALVLVPPVLAFLSVRAIARRLART